MFKDKLIFDVTEDPKLGQLKDLGEASDELVEIRNTAVEVLEHSESEEEDSDLEKVVQGELGVETTRVHRPDAPQVRAVQRWLAIWLLASSGSADRGHESRNCPLYQDKDLVYTLVTMQWGEHVDARGGH